MSHKKIWLIVGLLALLLSGFLVYLVNKFDLFFKKPAALVVNTNVPAQIFLNGKQLGTTPYTNTRLHPGTYKLELKPQNNPQLSPYQLEIKLSRRLTTSVYYNFASDVASSSGYLVEYEPNSKSDQASLSVLSDPDICSLALDSQPHGFTPLKPTPLKPGQHTVTLSSPGFQALEIKLNTLAGYNLFLKTKLARDLLNLNPSLEASNSASASATAQSPSKEATSSSTQLSRPYVVIQPTGTGWLRVRNKPNTTDSKEIGKADVGEKLKFIEANETGWYKVIFQGQEGWISGRYAKLYK